MRRYLLHIYLQKEEAMALYNALEQLFEDYPNSPSCFLSLVFEYDDYIPVAYSDKYFVVCCSPINGAINNSNNLVELIHNLEKFEDENNNLGI